MFETFPFRADSLLLAYIRFSEVLVLLKLETVQGAKEEILGRTSVVRYAYASPMIRRFVFSAAVG